jgi:2-polyprenyl-3-methyl-5-hydroxy-6-metoxy-1,4-benzoquinol methylase
MKTSEAVLPKSLENWRKEAAIASKGISSDVIYQLALKILDTVPAGHLLEYGAGTGSLIRNLVDLDYPSKITGADILTRPTWLPAQVDWVQMDLNNTLELADDSFDTIVSTEVIEHLENPRATFREFYRLLRPGGSAIITTPNQESIRALCGLLVGGHFVAFLGKSYPAHITALLRKDFTRICVETGFSEPSFYYTNDGGLPRMPSVHWQSLSFGLLKGRLFSDNIAVVTKTKKSVPPGAAGQRPFTKS